MMIEPLIAPGSLRVPGVGVLLQGPAVLDVDNALRRAVDLAQRHLISPSPRMGELPIMLGKAAKEDAGGRVRGKTSIRRFVAWIRQA